MGRRLILGASLVLTVGLITGTAQAGVTYADPVGGWAYIYTGDQCATQFDAALDGKWHHYDAGSGGSDAWDATAPGQMGASPTKPSPGGAGIFADGDTGFLRIQDCGDPRDAPNGGWADPSNRKLTFAHNITSEVTGGTSILDTGVTLSFRARIPTTPPLDPVFPDGGGGPQPWVTRGYNVHDDGYGAFGIKQGRSGLGVISFSLAMEGDEGDISGNGLTMNKRAGTSRSANVDSYDTGGTENTLMGFDPTQWHEFWIQIVADVSGGGTHKVTIWMDGDVKRPQTFHVTAGTKHEGNYDSWDGYLVMSLGRTGIAGAQDVDFFGYKAGLHAPVSFLKPGLASKPSPADEATDVYTGTTLGWKPGEFAAKHDVYLGTVLADVNNAGRSDPLGVSVSQAQDANTYDPAGDLRLETTYYWRVDEVNAPPSSTVYKGKVWSFTTEPVGVPITNVTAKASSSQLGMGPENTVNGSGMNSSDKHSAEGKEMWLSAGLAPNWIQFEFDKAYKLHELWVWNSNQSIVESFIGWGAKDVTIEYSTDGSAWALLAGVPVFTQASGMPDYAHDTVVNFGGVSAKYVKLTINSTWGGMPQCGLSEVRFLSIPVQARLPQPADGVTDQELAVALSWLPGRGAVSHKVYFGSDKQAVIDSTSLAGTVTKPGFDVASLDFGTTYYWKVVEVNDAATPSSWEGPVWQFTTKPYQVVDDFESYTNDSPKRVFQTWIDGWGFSEDEFFPKGNPGNHTGSMAGHDPLSGTIMETVVFHGGVQSMPVEYNNVNSPYYSEVERTWSQAQNWTIGSANTLVVWFRGQAPDFVENGGTITMGAAGTDIWNSADQFRFAHKKLTGNGVIIAKVDSVERANEWTKAGVMIRESLEADSRYAAVYITPDYGCRFQARAMTAQAATSDTAVVTTEQTAIKAPYWVKLERTGNDFKGYYSADGVTWKAMAWNPQTITMAAQTVYIGLAVTSHTTNPEETATAVFSNVAATGGVAAGAWQVAEIGIDHPSNSAEDLYVTIHDSTGKNATVMLVDGSIVSAWTEWKIPFSQLTGVKMSAVTKMIIGAGDRKNPKADGGGVLYIDDIRVLKAAP